MRISYFSRKGTKILMFSLYTVTNTLYEFKFLSLHFLSRKNLKVCLHYVITSARPKHETLSSATFRTPTKKHWLLSFWKSKQTKTNWHFFVNSYLQVVAFGNLLVVPEIVSLATTFVMASLNVQMGVMSLQTTVQVNTEKNKFLLWRFSWKISTHIFFSFRHNRSAGSDSKNE